MARSEANKRRHLAVLAVREKYKPYPKRVVTLITKGHAPCCKCCGSTEELTFDHIIPRDRGGSNLSSNGQILCYRCNNLKANFMLTIEELKYIYEKVGHITMERVGEKRINCFN